MTRLGLRSVALAIAALTIACVDAPAPQAKASVPPPGGFDTREAGVGTDGAACVNDPSFFDVPGDGCDNDGDGAIDNAVVCDDGETGDGAESFARGLGICTKASGGAGYGLVSAKFTRGHGREDAPQAEQHALLAKFGDAIRPREGKRLGVLSTGYAEEFNGAPNEPFSRGRDWYGATPTLGGNGTAPPGFPKGANGCPQVSEVNDVIDLRLELRAPKNARGFAFDFNFHSGEWPAFVCSRYNDGFVAYLSAKGFNGGKPDNISFDAMQNPVSVNNGFFDRCTPGITLGCGSAVLGPSKCPGGPSELAGTGFGIIGPSCDGNKSSTLGGATGWLFSQAPVAGGETFTLDLVIWDTGDGVLDSSVLLDDFRWIARDVATTTDRPDDVK